MNHLGDGLPLPSYLSEAARRMSLTSRLGPEALGWGFPEGQDLECASRSWLISTATFRP